MSTISAHERLHLAPYLYEKHLNHQDGVAGTVVVRLVEAKNLHATASMFWMRTCNPYVIFRVGKLSARSKTIQGNDNPSWRKEILELRVPKLDFKRVKFQENSNERVELILDVMNEDSYTGKATEVVGMSNGSMIGTASLDITSLLEGKDEVMDRWVTLGGSIGSNTLSKMGSGRGLEKNVVLGEVRVIVQYEPHGMEPMVGDIVKMEAFGVHPSAILPSPTDLELQVKRVSGSYLLCSYMTKSGFEGSIRLHRNSVFVTHRGSVLDRLYSSFIATPLEFVGNTPIGKTCINIARPYVNIAIALSSPAVTATRATVMTTLRASSAAARAVFWFST
jgi:hypothetical protein